MAEDSSIDFEDVVKAIVVLAGAYALQGALNPRQKSKSASSDVSMQQSLPPCIYLVGGYSRTGGAKLFYESAGNWHAIIIAFNDGRVDSIDSIYFGDDKVVLDSNGWVQEGADHRWGQGDKILVKSRLGLPTETVYGEVVTLFPTLWSSNHRIDGTGTVMVRAEAVRASAMAQVYPTGQIRDVGVVSRAVCFDWRDPAQDREDVSTWGPSLNAIVWLVHLEWTRWGTDWEDSIAPVLDALTIEADICDEAVPLAAGGTEPRYTAAFNFTDEDDERSVRGKLLAAMDGFYTLDGFDRLVARAGKYRPPTVELVYDPPFGEILTYTWTAGVAPEQAVSEINVQFTNPDTDYNVGDVDPWPVSPEGRPDDLDLTFVTSWRQARRLAKRRASRLNAARRGTIVTDLRGMAAWSEQYILIRNVDEPSMDNVVCEIVDAPELDMMAGTVTFQIISTDINIDAWNPETEEGSPPAVPPRAAAEPLPDPVIADAEAMFVDTTSARISIEATGPSRSDITWSSRWRIHGSTSWNESTDTSLSGGAVTLTTGTLPVNASIDVGVRYRTGGGAPSNWSADTVVSTSVADIPPGPVISPAATGGVGLVNLAWTNPESGNYNRVVVRRATNSGMTGAVEVVTKYGSPVEVMTHSDTGLSAGTYYYTFTAYNPAAAASTTPAPQPVSATVT